MWARVTKMCQKSQELQKGVSSLLRGEVFVSQRCFAGPLFGPSVLFNLGIWCAEEKQQVITAPAPSDAV